jgi:ribose 5-phosphate isomerase A
MSTEAATARYAAARAAVKSLTEGSTIGLGSGRAVVAVIELAAQRWPAGPPLLCVVASSETDRLARGAGFAVAALDDLDLKRRGPDDSGPGGSAVYGSAAGGIAARGDSARGSRSAALLDLVVDGADEVDPQLDLLKGGGGALLREKLLARAAARRIVIVEDEKLTPYLGERHALPVEVVRFGWRETRRALLELLPAAALRHGADGRPFLSDEGHYIVDCSLVERGGEGLPALAAALKALPGVVDHGLFFGVADEVVVGHADGSVERRVRGA